MPDVCKRSQLNKSSVCAAYTKYSNNHKVDWIRGLLFHFKYFHLKANIPKIAYGTLISLMYIVCAVCAILFGFLILHQILYHCSVCWIVWYPVYRQIILCYRPCDTYSFRSLLLCKYDRDTEFIFNIQTRTAYTSIYYS